MTGGFSGNLPFMEISPFPFHGPLEPDEVIGRDDVVAHLIEQVTARRPTVLIAPRRFGKTSVLRRVAAELEPTSTVIDIDLYELRSWADLAARLDDGLTRSRADARRRLDEIAAGLELNLGVVKASLTGRSAGAPDIVVDRLLDVIVTHARRTPTTLIIDEFSSIGRLDGAAGLLRTKFQHHYTTMGLIFAGSAPSTMRMLFSNMDQPFYAQADLVTLPALDQATVTHVIDRGFAGRPPSGLGAHISGFARGHPQRTMQLADAAWRVRDASDDAQVWEAALATVRTATADGFEVRFSTLSTADQAVLRLVADGEPLHGRAAEALALSSSSADRSRRSLTNDGQIADESGLVVVDPLFADWLQRRFPS